MHVNIDLVFTSHRNPNVYAPHRPPRSIEVDRTCLAICPPMNARDGSGPCDRSIVFSDVEFWATTNVLIAVSENIINQASESALNQGMTSDCDLVITICVQVNRKEESITIRNTVLRNEINIQSNTSRQDSAHTLARELDSVRCLSENLILIHGEEENP